MLLRQLTGKKICILGFGREGQATLAALEREKIDADITIVDSSAGVPAREGYDIMTGESHLDNLDQYDVIIKSPGIKPTPKLEALGSKLTNATQIFLDEAKARGSMVIGVTGTKGKSTTSSLIYEILKEAGKDVHLVGNIGIPALDHLDHAKSGALFVMELSSAQLMDITTSPHIAVITSFFPEHLDYHGTVDAYRDAKAHITRFQTKNDTVVFHHRFDEVRSMAEQSKGTNIPCSESDTPVSIEETKLIGAHNLGNIALAWKACEVMGIDRTTAIEAIKNFTPLRHRLESLGLHHGIEWVDDAISTTPQSAIAAIDALGERVGSIILGGQDRGLDFSPLAERLSTSSIKHVILFGEDGPRIGDEIVKKAPMIALHSATTMEEVIQQAIDVTPKGTVCLLSPASPSYDMFKNYEEKGDRFAEEIKKEKRTRQ